MRPPLFLSFSGNVPCHGDSDSCWKSNEDKRRAVHARRPRKGYNLYPLTTKTAKETETTTMAKYHIFSTGNGMDHLGWCYREILPLRVTAEGFRWETAERVSPCRVRGKGWEAVEAGHLTADEIVAKNRHDETEAERRKAEMEAARAARAKGGKGVGKGGAAAIKVTATETRTGKETCYKSIREAERALHVNKTTVARYARKGEAFGGYLFRIE